jgi:propionate CoA-transferase
MAVGNKIEGHNLPQDVLAHVGFESIILGEPRMMGARIFAAERMGLKDDLLTVPLEARFVYDAERNIFFLNMEGMSLVTHDEVEAIVTEVDKRLAAIGKKVQMVVNYDNFFLAPDLTDDYASLVRGLAEALLRQRDQVHDQLVHAAQAQRAAVPPRTGPAHL